MLFDFYEKIRLLTIEIIRLYRIALRLEVADRHIKAAMVLTILKFIGLVFGAIRDDDRHLIILREDQDFSYNLAHFDEILGLIVLANDAPLAVSCEPDNVDIVGSRFLSPDELEPSPRPWVLIAPRAGR